MMSKKETFRLHQFAASILKGDEIELDTLTSNELREVIREIQYLTNQQQTEKINADSTHTTPETDRSQRDDTTNTTCGISSQQFAGVMGHSQSEIDANQSTSLILSARPEIIGTIKQITHQMHPAETSPLKDIVRLIHENGVIYHTRQVACETIYQGKPAVQITHIDAGNNHNIEAKKSEEPLYLHTFFEDSGLGVLLQDSSGRILACNANILAGLGYQSAELQGKTLAGLTPCQTDGFLHEMEQSLLQGAIEVYEHEIQLLRRDRSTMHCNFAGTTVRTNGHSNTFILSIFEDISYRIISEEALQKTQVEIESILDNTSEMISLLSPGLNIQWINRSAAEWSGFYSNEISGKHCHDIWGLSDNPCPACPVDEVIRTRKKQRFNLQLPGDKNLSIQVSPILSRDGSVCGIVETASDTSVNKRLEVTLKHRLEMEALTSDLSTRFIALNTEHTEREIDNTLEKLGKLMRNRRCYLMKYGENKKKLSLLNEWNEDGLDKLTPSFSRDISSIIEWHIDKFGVFDNIYIPTSDELPAGVASNKQYWEEAEVLPLLLMPLKIENELAGCLGLCHQQVDDEWLPYDWYMLSHVTEIFAGALLRQENFNRLKQNERKFRLLADVIHTGIIIYRSKHILYANPAAEQLTGFTMSEIEQNGLVQSMLTGSQAENDRQSPAQDNTTVTSFITKSGNPCWIDYQTAPICIEGKPAILLAFVDITQRIHFENALKESEEIFRSFIEESYDGMVLVDEQGKIIVWNSSMQQITGLKPVDVLGKPLWKILTSISTREEEAVSLGQHYKNAIQSVMDTGNTSFGKNIIENAFIRADGEKRIMQSLTFPIKTRKGWMGGNIGRDITEFKRLQEENRRQQLEIETIFNAIPALIYFKDKDAHLIRVNKAFQEVTGYSDDYFKQQPTSYDMAVRWQLADEHCEDDREVMRTGKAKHQIIRPLISDESRLFRITKVPYRDEQGEIIGVIGFAFDATEQVNAEKALRQSQARYLSIFENSPTAIAEVDLSVFKKYVKQVTATEDLSDFDTFFNTISDKDAVYKKYMRFVDVNRAAITLFEADSKEYFLGHSHRLLSQANLERIRQEVKALLAGKTWFEGRSTQITFKDRLIHTIIRMNIPPEYEESWEKIYLSFVDITEQVKAEEAIRNSLEEKEVMLREIHHRVKNNLQVIASLLNLQSAHVFDKRDLKLFDMSRERVRSMALVHEKLYRSPNMAQVDFEDYLQQLSRDLVRAFSVHTTIDLDVNVRHIFLPVDQAIPCGLIVHELVMNCVKYAFPNRSEGHIIITMDTTLSKEAENIHNIYTLSVQDDGVGIPDEKDIYKNDSLGLQLVKILTRQLHGTMEILTNNGTTINIHFPQSFPVEPDF